MCKNIKIERNWALEKVFSALEFIDSENTWSLHYKNETAEGKNHISGATKSSVWIVSLSTEKERWKEGNCTCTYFLEKYMCNHVIGLVIRLKLAKPPAAAKDVLCVLLNFFKLFTDIWLIK